MAFKSLGDTTPTIWNLDAPAGTVGMHGQPPFAGITWTSPMSGTATISGDVWKMRNNIGRTIEWRLELNGSLLTGGTLTEANPYTSANPFFLADGSGGAAALTIQVTAGDVIGLLAGSSVSQDSDFVGVNWSVSVVPEPSSVVLLGLGALGLFVAAKRRRVTARIARMNSVWAR